MMHTENLDILPLTLAQARALLDALSPAEKAEVSPDGLARVEAALAEGWPIAFSIVLRRTGAPIGSCAYKGLPTGDGAIEIAYGIDANERGNGYASEAAAALTDHALQTGRVRIVRAHTRADNAASQRVLAKSGFALVGEVIDPEDGPVLRFERRSAESM